VDEDKFIIIASDGVWEFIESDEVSKLYLPELVCKHDKRLLYKK